VKKLIIRNIKYLLLLAAVLGCQQSYSADTLRVVFTGDVMLDRGVRMQIEHRGIGSLFSPSVDSLFSCADRVVGNLECPATTIVSPNFKRFIFRAEPSWLNALREHGFTHLNLANNHSIDQGREGLLSTIDNIKSAGMVPFGAGRNLAEATKPTLLAEQPRKVYLLSSLQMGLENMAFLPQKASVSQYTIDSLITEVQRLKQQEADAVIIVSLHWGGEHTLRPVPLQIEQAHMLIDAGADALICHHTHTMQTVETYEGKPIYYSIGNFIFDPKREINRQACVVSLLITAEKVVAETLPITIDGCTPHLSAR